MKTLLQLLTLTLFLSMTVSLPASAKKKKAKIDLTALKKDSVDADVKRVKKDATVKKGLFTTYFNEKTGKLYFEIPDSMFGRQLMLASRVISTSDGQDSVAGQVNTRPFLIVFSTDGRNVYMHQVQDLMVVRPGDAIASSFDRNNMNPVL
ncbi:MAG: DUF5118 domain-containing protein, partial [Prevotella sp.]|nr:DUF5118 domain-containing protein [Prevotella sp.]